MVLLASTAVGIVTQVHSAPTSAAFAQMRAHIPSIAVLQVGVQVNLLMSLTTA